MTKAGLSVLVVDDEVAACENIVNMLREYVGPGINVLGSAYDTLTAEALIREHSPNAVFLDIEMPGENAFQFLHRIGSYDFEIIFVTAYDQFAVQAFKLSAIDYILKPLCIEELTEAVEKLRQKILFKSLALNKEHQLDVLRNIAGREKQQKLALKGANNIEVIDFKDIYYIEGSGSYSRFCFKKKDAAVEMTVSNSIYEYESILPAERFFRIHKSYLINCSHIRKIVSEDASAVVIGAGNIQLPVSRRKFPGFIEFLKEHKFYSE